MSPAAGHNSLTAERLRIFVERIDRPADRIAYLVDALDQCRDISGRTMSRAFGLASRVIGVEYDVGRMAMMKALVGFTAEAEALCAPDVGRVCGFVYRASIQSMPSAVKIGFSTKLSNRLAALASIYREPVTLLSAEPGTMLDEHAEHCRLHAQRITGEWFRAEEMAA